MVHHYRVDQQFSNSFEKWKTMGKPQQVTPQQYEELERAGQLQLYSSPEWKTTNNGNVMLQFAVLIVTFMSLSFLCLFGYALLAGRAEGGKGLWRRVLGRWRRCAARRPRAAKSRGSGAAHLVVG